MCTSISIDSILTVIITYIGMLCIPVIKLKARRISPTLVRLINAILFIYKCDKIPKYKQFCCGDVIISDSGSYHEVMLIDYSCTASKDAFIITTALLTSRVCHLLNFNFNCFLFSCGLTFAHCCWLSWFRKLPDPNGPTHLYYMCTNSGHSCQQRTVVNIYNHQNYLCEIWYIVNFIVPENYHFAMV